MGRGNTHIYKWFRRLPQSKTTLREKFFTALLCKRGHLTLCDFSYKSKKNKNLGITIWKIKKINHCRHISQFSHSVRSNSLRPYGLQHIRPPCPSPTPGVHSNTCPVSRWCHPAISSSVVPFSSCPQFLPASGSFPMSQLFAGGGQSIGVLASGSVLPMNTQDWFPLGWLVGSPCSPRDSQESSPTPQFKSINSLALSFLHSPTLTSTHDHWKNHSLD